MKNNQKEKRQIIVFKGLVTNKNGEFLLIKRNEKRLPDAHDKWELPGGKAHFGEKPEDAIEREILEEAGVQVEVRELLPITFTSNWDYPKYLQHTIILCFKCELLSSLGKISKMDHRVQEIKWVNPRDIYKYDTLPGIKEIVNYAIRVKY